MTDFRCQRTGWRFLLASGLFLMPLHASAAAFNPDTYETEIRKQARIPDEWLACDKAKDCVIAAVPCQTGIAVARQHKLDAEGAVCQEEDCNTMCSTTEIAKSYATCEDEVCVLKLGAPPRKTDEDKPPAKKLSAKKTDADEDGDSDKFDPRDLP